MTAADYAAVTASPVGVLGIRMVEQALAGIDILSEGVAERCAECTSTKAVVAALKRYFGDPHAGFGVPLRLAGSAFQQQVWALLRTIPVGCTVTYATLARRVPSSARAIGQACRANPVPIIVPCHRVVAATGLGGFMGGSASYLHVKRWLIQHEAKASAS